MDREDKAKMSDNFNECWLKWAVEIEDEADCDIEAGLNLGQHLREYLAKTYLEAEISKHGEHIPPKIQS